MTPDLAILRGGSRRRALVPTGLVSHLIVRTILLVQAFMMVHGFLILRTIRFVYAFLILLAFPFVQAFLIALATRFLRRDDVALDLGSNPVRQGRLGWGYLVRYGRLRGEHGRQHQQHQQYTASQKFANHG